MVPLFMGNGTKASHNSRKSGSTSVLLAGVQDAARASSLRGFPKCLKPYWEGQRDLVRVTI